MKRNACYEVRSALVTAEWAKSENRPRRPPLGGIQALKLDYAAARDSHRQALERRQRIRNTSMTWA